MAKHKPFNLVVLISGYGSNLQAIIDQIEQGKLPVQISAVISNRADAYGLTRARQHHIPTHVIDHHDYADRTGFEHALSEVIEHYQPNLIVLAGFMRILTSEFVQKYLGKMINIHPSLLPRHQGLNTHARVLQANDEEHGATVHYVVPELDSGPVILQTRIPVLPTDTAQTLEQRVHDSEYRLYPEAIRRIASGQLSFRNGAVYYGQQPIMPEQQQLR
jgi:phosphoribosylglycinamide formyltransferase-1